MTISITIAVDGQTIRQIDNVPWQAGMNGQQAMERAYGSGAGYSFLLQYFGPQLGYEVVSIDNIASQSGTDAFLFWEFSVNGVLSSTEVDETVLNDGDQIGWNFKKYDDAAHSASRYAAIKRQASAKP